METNALDKDLSRGSAGDEASNGRIGTAERTLCTLALFVGSAMVIAAVMLAFADH